MYNNTIQLIDNKLDSKGFIRAGIIPFTVYNNNLYFLLGVDRRTRELTDFGGGIKSTENIINGALRELHEESCEIFKNCITSKVLTQSIVLINDCKNTAIFFVYIQPHWLNIAENDFKTSQEKFGNSKKYNELVGVKWIIEHDFNKIVFNRHNQCMWKRIQNIILWNTNWIELKHMLLNTFRQNYRYKEDNKDNRDNRDRDIIVN